MDNGSMVWRPLENGATMQHQTFAATNVRGFGLVQRDRKFIDYQDLFRTYNLAPTVWVAPHGNWGNGEVHLVELSTQYEGLDNVVAFWNPDSKPAPLQPLRFGYTLYWTREIDMTLSTNEVVSTRIGLNPRDQQQRQFVIDFDIPKLKTDDDTPKANVTCSDNGTIAEVQVFRNAPENTWRAFVNMLPKAGNKDPVDLKCTLSKGDVTSETWTYHWTPP
jgi:glucans biosynthesis protein